MTRPKIFFVSLWVCARNAIADPNELAPEIERIVADGQVPGLSVAIAKQGRILWEKGFGWADVEKGIKATERTPFYIASVTKSVTASAIMQLQERGKIRLDTAVNEYLPGSKLHSPKWDVKQATVRRLLSHTGGLTTFARWCRPGERGCEIKEEIEHYAVLVWPPGEVFDYSNLGYGILGYVIERVSKQSLDSYLSNNLFAPLGMHRCGMNGGKSIGKTQAAQYQQESHRRVEPKISGHPGASGLYCSAHDLLLFAMFHLHQGKNARPRLSRAAIEETHRAQLNTRGSYGLGWWVNQKGGRLVISAQGGTTSSYALVTLIPSEDLAVVVLANSYSNSVSQLGDRIVARLVPGFAPSEAGGTGETVAKDAAITSPVSGKWSGEILTFKGPVRASPEIGADGSSRGQVGSKPMAPLPGISVKPRHFYGQLGGDASIPESPAGDYTLELDLGLYGNDLIGAATTRPPSGEDGDQLPHWIKLSRVP